jgi:uncharacterized protein (TIGR03032 family)
LSQPGNTRIFKDVEGLARFVCGLDLSLFVSTYTAGRIFAIGHDGYGTLRVLPVHMPRPMGVAFHGSRMAVATLRDIQVFFAHEEAGRNLPFSFQQFQTFYTPRISYYTGPLDIHDLYLTSKGMLAVATKFSCLATFTTETSFKPIWTPKFITELRPEDRCHLNGLAMDGEVPAYVTMLGTGDRAGSWREKITTGGQIVRVADHEVLAAGLGMPHNPRLVGNRLYFLESAKGHLAYLDLETGQKHVVAELGRFVRGLVLVGQTAVVAYSKLRATSSTFAKLQGVVRGDTSGILGVDLLTGTELFNAEFLEGVDEVYDVQARPGGSVGIMGASDAAKYELITIKGSSFWQKREPN